MPSRYRPGFAPRPRAGMGAPNGIPTTWDSIARPQMQLPGSRGRPLMGTPGGPDPNPALSAVAAGPAPGGIGPPQQRLPMVPPSTNNGAFALPPSAMPPMATPAPNVMPVQAPRPAMGMAVPPQRGRIP